MEIWSRLVLLQAAITVTSGVSLHKFPSNSALRKKWVDQVKRHRDKWEPTAYSVLCSQLFEPSCFIADYPFPITGVGQEES